MLRNRSFLILATLISISNIFLSSIATGEQPPSISSSCSTAIKDGENRLSKIKSLKLVRLNLWRNTSQSYFGNRPGDRPWSYTYVFSGRGQKDVYASPVLLNVISTHVIQNCSEVSLVEFGIYQSGANTAYGLMPTGKVAEFECLSGEKCYGLSALKKLPWGKNCC